MSDFCPKCHRPWHEHDFGVPQPYCPIIMPLIPPTKIEPPPPTQWTADDLARLNKVLGNMFNWDLPESEGGLTD